MTLADLYIEDDHALECYLDSIAAQQTLALDTEFVREKTYFPQLCLVQIATPRQLACVDCLAALDEHQLLARLVREDTRWIVHSSRQDLEVIYQHTQQLPRVIIDTQIAAGLIGYPPQIGLQDLVADLLGVALDKTHTRTDWSKRPLPPAALAYALDDVRNLHALWDRLATRLDELERRAWLEQDCAQLLAQAPTTSPEQIWARLRGLRSLDGASQAAALALVEWREAEARARDRPRRWILADEGLVGIARARPATLAALGAVPDLAPRLVGRAGRDILRAIEAAAAAQARVAALLSEEAPDKRTLQDLQRRARDHAAALGIHAEVLATKQELVDFTLGREPPRVARTWRAAELRELVGDA